MRNSSGGKFSLGSAFGRKSDKHDRQASYSGTNDFGQQGDSPGHSAVAGRSPGIVSGGGGGYDQPDSPGAQSAGQGGGGASFKKLGKTFAHNNLLPGLGNKDLKALQDVIAAEKGVLSGIEKLSQETQKAASLLPNYGLQEGPDLQDILTQSSHLLSYFASAMTVYAERQISLRGAYKKIRDREEAMMELRSYRRSVGSKAERKLAKMGPENKALQGQTETLERLRQEMRQLDTEIVKEESTIGDFKRQTIKEAFMYKFSGLEELGEKLCIIGEMGKLVIEEVPLEETPVGYGRAPYGGFTKTESAVEEAGRCLGQVKFSHVETSLKPSHLPHAQHLPSAHGLANLPRQESIAAAEEFAHYPGGVPSPQTPGRQPYAGGAASPPQAGYGLDDNPYGGIQHRMGGQQPRPSQGRGSNGAGGDTSHAYGEYGGVRDTQAEQDNRRQTLWQGPTEEALREQNRGSDGIQYAQARIASMYGHPVDDVRVTPPAHQRTGSYAPTPPGPHLPQQQQQQGPSGDDAQDYEYQQQLEMDRQHAQEQAAWRDQPSAGGAHGPASGSLPNPYGDIDDAETPVREQSGVGSGQPSAAAAATGPSSTLSAPWQPLNVNRSKSATPEPRTLHDPPVTVRTAEPSAEHSGAAYDAAPAPPAHANPDYHEEYTTQTTSTDHDLAPPPSMSKLTARSVTPATEDFRTPAESPEDPAAAFAFPQATVPPVAATAPAQEHPAASPPLPPVPQINADVSTDTAYRPASPGYTSPTGTGNKMSAGAFRKAAPRRSETGNGNGEEGAAAISRRLPVPPSGSGPNPSSPGANGSSSAGPVGGWPDEKKVAAAQQRQREAFGDAREEHEAPPVYNAPGHDSESLR